MGAVVSVDRGLGDWEVSLEFLVSGFWFSRVERVDRVEGMDWADGSVQQDWWD